MDTNKIKEAAGKIWLNATSHGTEEPYATLSKIILAELDKSQQPAAGMTVEEAVIAIQDCYTAMGWTLHHAESELRARLTAAIEAKTSKA